MDSAKLNDWLQVIGLFGVIASLIFVGLQMKQDREIALTERFNARSDTTVQLYMSMADNPVLRTAREKIRNGAGDQLTEDEQAALTYLSQAALTIYENTHFQYVNGYIDDEHWNRTVARIKSDIVSGNLRREYDNSRDQWRKSLQAVMDELIDEVDSASRGQ
jgi:hypothetical protein